MSCAGQPGESCDPISTLYLSTPDVLSDFAPICHDINVLDGFSPLPSAHSDALNGVRTDFNLQKLCIECRGPQRASSRDCLCTCLHLTHVDYCRNAIISSCFVGHPYCNGASGGSAWYGPAVSEGPLQTHNSKWPCWKQIIRKSVRYSSTKGSSVQSLSGCCQSISHTQGDRPVYLVMGRLFFQVALTWKMLGRSVVSSWQVLNRVALTG